MKNILLLLVLFCGTVASAQSELYRREAAFSDHLFTNRLYREGILHYRKLLSDTTLSMAQRDTLDFRLGFCFRQYAQLDSSVYAYGRVGNSTRLYEQSTAAAMEQLLKAGRYQSAHNYLGAVGPRDDNQFGYKMYWRTATAFLANDTALLAADSVSLLYIKGGAVEFTNRLRKEMNRVTHIKKKSPALAAGLSAVVPGLGKVYAGRPRHGLAAFLPCAVLGFEAAEAYKNGGWKDTRFLVCSSLFSVFYIGNIYGSALTVKAVRNETINDARYRIQADLVLSLRQFSR